MRIFVSHIGENRRLIEISFPDLEAAILRPEDARREPQPLPRELPRFATGARESLDRHRCPGLIRFPLAVFLFSRHKREGKFFISIAMKHNSARLISRFGQRSRTLPNGCARGHVEIGIVEYEHGIFAT